MPRLSDASIKSLPLPESNSRIHYDDAVAGFGIRLTAKGARSFIFNYRVRGSGRERRATIGAFGDWTTAGARAKAKELRRLVDDGGDPVGDIEAERKASTVADLIERFEEEHLPKRRPGTVRGYKVCLDKYIRPALGSIKVADVTFADVDALHRKVTKVAGPYAANRVHAVLSIMFKLAVRWGMRDSSPTKGVERNDENARERYLSGDELARLLDVLAKHPEKQAADIVRMLLLTGARKGEVMAMRWDQLDLTAGIWSKPASATKQKKTHTVPLSAPARQLLAEIEQTSEWVFPSYGGSGHVVGINKAWEGMLRKAAISNFRIHDLRHSFASQLVSGGASLPLIGALLGHARPGTTARYSHLFRGPAAGRRRESRRHPRSRRWSEQGGDRAVAFPERRPSWPLRTSPTNGSSSITCARSSATSADDCAAAPRAMARPCPPTTA